MAEQSLAVKYRPKTFDDLTEQGAVKTILLHQLATHTTKNAYLFCGGAGTGKTTSARIFASEINDHKGTPIELDAASHNSVDDVREIIAQSKTKNLESDYKVFIIDECHSLSNQAWQAFLKVLEEPPKMSIFIFCTTDPNRIPKTILSRVQRYDFQRISHQGIVKRLNHILECENVDMVCKEYGDECSKCNAYANGGCTERANALDYIAKIADGGMRDAITLMDKCLAYNTNLTLENVVAAIGATDYEVMFEITNNILYNEPNKAIKIIDNIHMQGKDVKLFVKGYMGFILDICKYNLTHTFEFISIPSLYEDRLRGYNGRDIDFTTILDDVVKLNADIKWETSAKAFVEADMILLCIKLGGLNE